MSGRKTPNLVLKRMVNLRRLYKKHEYKEENFKPETDELYQLENKQAKGAKLCANISK